MIISFFESGLGEIHTPRANRIPHSNPTVPTTKLLRVALFVLTLLRLGASPLQNIQGVEGL